MDAVAYDLPLLAPIPRGHDGLMACLKRSGSTPTEFALVLDQTAGVLYCEEPLWGALGLDPRADTDPVGVLTGSAWTVTRSFTGAVTRCIVSTSCGAANRAKTRMFVAPPNSAPYR
jgi:hypothetical protein